MILSYHCFKSWGKHTKFPFSSSMLRCLWVLPSSYIIFFWWTSYVKTKGAMHIEHAVIENTPYQKYQSSNIAQLIHDLSCLVNSKNVVIKRYNMFDDESVLWKIWVMQHSFEVTLPAHLAFAQRLFGTAAGIDTRRFLSCKLKNEAIISKPSNTIWGWAQCSPIC